MNPAILVISNLILFFATCVAGLFGTSLLTRTLIGFYTAARLAVLTPDDVISQQKHRNIIASVIGFSLILSALFFYGLGEIGWSSFILGPTIGLLVGIWLSFNTNKSRLLPNGWKPRT